MLQLDNVTDFEWRRLIERLDKAVAESARLYLQSLHARRVPIKADSWEHKLDELRLAREPDYQKAGLPLVYALKYMPRRVISILGSLWTVAGDRYPSSVLDIGSGTGSTALALDVTNAPRHINLHGIEPSPEMIAFAQGSRFAGRVSARYTKGSIEDGALGRIPLEPYDLVVFSASFPYQFDEWDALLDSVGSYEGNRSKMILVVEPEAKVDILDSFARRLRHRGWPTERLCCHDLPEIVKREDIPLKEMTHVWERIGLPGSTAPRTWWTPPNEKYLIANPEPSWPSPGENRMLWEGSGARTLIRHSLPYSGLKR